MDIVYFNPAGALAGRHPRVCSLHDHLLHAYLPYFTTNHFRNEPDVDLILESFLHSHPDYLESSSQTRAREHNFREAFYLVIDCIRNEEEGGPEAWRTLNAKLEDALIASIRFGRRGNRALKLFRALADVSRAAGGRSAINFVLKDFLLSWLYELAEHEDEVSLASWCRSVKRSSMHDQDKAECLDAIFAFRPDALAELHRREADWLHMHSSKASVRSWPRRRRATGRAWWDHDTARQIERLFEEQDRLDHAADRRRRRLALQWGEPDYYRWPRHQGRVRPSRSFESILGLLDAPERESDDMFPFDSPAGHTRYRRSRSPLLLPPRSPRRPRSTSFGDRHLDVNPADYMKDIVFDRDPRMLGPRVEDLA